MTRLCENCGGPIVPSSVCTLGAKKCIDYWGDEPNGVGYWMIEWEQKEKVKHRIACPEQGYPESEALYSSVAEWEKETGGNWNELMDMV